MSKQTSTAVGILAIRFASITLLQMKHNSRNTDWLFNHKEVIESLDACVKHLNGRLSLLDGCYYTNFENIAANLRQLDKGYLSLLNYPTNEFQLCLNEILGQQKRINQLADGVKADRETVRVMSSLFAERLKDHATLFAMTGRLSESVASLTNLIRSVGQPEVRR